MKRMLRADVISLGALALGAHAACPSDVEAAAMAASYATLQPAPNAPADMTMARRDLRTRQVHTVC